MKTRIYTAPAVKGLNSLWLMLKLTLKAEIVLYKLWGPKGFFTLKTS